MLPGDLTLDYMILRANFFILKKLVLKMKNILIEKTFKLVEQLIEKSTQVPYKFLKTEKTIIPKTCLKTTAWNK